MPRKLQVAPYLTLGEEDTVTFEAEAAAQGFEDINATATLRLLQKTMRKEETALLGGNASLALGTPAAPTLTASGTGATLPAATYSVIVVALTFEGFTQFQPRRRRRDLEDHHRQRRQHLYAERRLLDAQRQRDPGGDARPDAERDRFRRHRRRRLRLVCRRRRRRDAAGDHHHQQRDASAPPSPPASRPRRVITADNSRNATLAFDGLLTVGFNPANNAYVQALASGTAGTGSFLTASGRGSVLEIDNMLVAMWNNYRLSPTVLYVNAQEQRNITNKCLTNASGPLIRYNVAADSDNGGPYGVSASGVVRWYYNPFSVDGGFDIPVKVHPDLPPGTILALCERLPVWYQSNQTPNVAEVLTRRDYYRVDWPLRTRRREYGVYAEETLAVYAPFGIGILTNIGNG